MNTFNIWMIIGNGFTYRIGGVSHSGHIIGNECRQHTGSAELQMRIRHGF